MHIYRNFADAIRNLNEQTPTADMRRMSFGRAYEKASGIYSDQVHVKSVCENHTETQIALAERADLHGKIYAGGAGIVNLGYIAALKPSAVILYDLNYAQSIFWREIIKAAAKYERLEDFVNYFKKSKMKVVFAINSELIKSGTLHYNAYGGAHALYTGLETYRGIDSVTNWLEGKRKGYGAVKPVMSDRSWMTDENYAVIHALAKNNAIGTMTLDITNEACFKDLKDCLTNDTFTSIDTVNPVDEGNEVSGLTIGTFYTSNIFDYLSAASDWSNRPLDNTQATPLQRGTENVQSLLGKDSIVISCHAVQDANMVPLDIIKPIYS